MAYAQTFWRVQFGGTLFVSEEWACTINMGAPGGDVDGDPDATELTAIRTAINSWFVSGNSYCSNAAKLGFVKANQVGTDGNYVNPFGAVEYIFPTPPAGGGPSAAPAQVSVVLSWTTARARGPGAHGRIYPPSSQPSPDATGLIPLAVATTMATSAKTLLDALNDVRAGTQVIVASQGGVAGTPAHVPVTGVRVGRIADTQVRRRKSLLETYYGPVALESV